MAKIYHVKLTEEERLEIEKMIQRGKVAGYKIKHSCYKFKRSAVK